MSVADKNMLLVFERKILRMILGAVCDPDGSRCTGTETLFLRSTNNNYGG